MGILHIVYIYFLILCKKWQNYSNREQTVVPEDKGARSQYKGILLGVGIILNPICDGS